jgi:disulfide bond formation protein DsbB
MKQGILYQFNSVAKLLVLSMLLGAFYFQFGLVENPCPLCLLQRMGMIGVIMGLSLNTFFGLRKEHFGVVILSALVGASFSVRQILLHICPVTGEATGYGDPILGMHLYSWGLIGFLMSIVGSVIFLFLIDDSKTHDRKPSIFEKSVFYLTILVIAVNVVATLFECQLGPCCENGPCP